jgi:hypothetical protein
VTPILPIVMVNREHPEKVLAYACGKCGSMFPLNPHITDPENKALRCCVSVCACGEAATSRYNQRCKSCDAVFEEEKEAKKFEKATKVPSSEYIGLVYWQGHSGSCGDGYFADVDEVLDYCEQEDIAVPKYVWACESEQFRIQIDVDTELENQEAFEDAGSQISESERKRLDDFLEEWSKMQNVVFWHEDGSRAVVLHEPDASEEPTAVEG